MVILVRKRRRTGHEGGRAGHAAEDRLVGLAPVDREDDEGGGGGSDEHARREDNDFVEDDHEAESEEVCPGDLEAVEGRAAEAAAVDGHLDPRELREERFILYCIIQKNIISKLGYILCTYTYPEPYP